MRVNAIRAVCKTVGGEVQVVAEEVVVLNAVRGALPFLISSGQEDATREDVRLR